MKRRLYLPLVALLALAPAARGVVAQLVRLGKAKRLFVVVRFAAPAQSRPSSNPPSRSRRSRRSS